MILKLFKPLLKTATLLHEASSFILTVPYAVKTAGSLGKTFQQSRRVYKRKGGIGLINYWKQMGFDRRNIILEPTDVIEKIKKGDLVIILTTQHTVYIAELFKKSLGKIGVNTEIIFDSHASEYSDSWHIVICPNMFTHLPRFYYAYQMEQSVSSKWFTKGYFNRLFRAKAVFDYSIANIAYLQRNGVPFQKLFYMPVGLLGSDIVQPDSSYTYDVLFYGDVNCPRRRLFLDKLKSKFKVKELIGVFGDELRKELSKAKIIVNVHYYENALLETTRIYECLSLNKLVISETSADQKDHQDLHEVVDFTEIGNVDQMIERIEYWLGHSEEYKSRIQLIKNLKNESDKFQFYFYRFLLSQDIIDFETFYSLSADYIKPENDFWCLSLPESIERRADFDRDNKFGIVVIPGLRHSMGWVGCGLSYKFMMRRAYDFNLKNVTICEDDVLFFDNFEKRYSNIKNALTKTFHDWDVFSGLIADLSEDVEVQNTEIKIPDERIYKISHMVSAVCNIYNQQVYEKLANWDETNRDTSNTIDRYIEQHEGVNGLVVSPFLVGHKEDLNSTLWGSDNGRYSKMIRKSQILLNSKIFELSGDIDVIEQIEN